MAVANSSAIAMTISSIFDVEPARAATASAVASVPLLTAACSATTSAASVPVSPLISSTYRLREPSRSSTLSTVSWRERLTASVTFALHASDAVAISVACAAGGVPASSLVSSAASALVCLSIASASAWILSWEARSPS